MAWVTINKREYYYRSAWENGSVKTSYFGNTPSAKLTAVVFETLDKFKQKQKEIDELYIAKLSAVFSSTGESTNWISSLTHADALVTGFIRHERGSAWRRKAKKWNTVQ